MIKILEATMLIGALIFTVWLECSIMRDVGIFWAMFFGGFFFLPWATAAGVALLRRTTLE